MKKIINILLNITLVVSCLFLVEGTAVNVSAQSTNYSMQCDNYEVSTVADNGQFNLIGCYGSFAEAKGVMQNSGVDAVVRHNNSYSPTKIIAMNSGLVISYPRRTGADTLIVSQDGGKTTYVTQHREMSGGNTTSYDGAGDGQIEVKLNGFEGYTSLKQVDLVPMKYITNNIPITLGGKDATANNEQPFSLVVKQSHYSIEQNGNYKELVFYAYSGYNASQFKMVVGPAADWMSVGDVYYSWNNYEFYSDRNYTQYVGTYYNYYQFLPLRTQSQIPAESYNEYLSTLGISSKPASNNFNDLDYHQSQLWDEGANFINAQNTYGVNALLIFAMACLESGNGKSRYAVERNNLFGWNAVDSDPDQASYFSSIPQSINEHMGVNLRGYLDIMDVRFFGSHVGNKGSGFNVKYASDPYWGAKIASIAYSIDKLSNDYDGTLTDYNTYNLGLITEYDAVVKSSNSASSSTLYTTTYGNSYQSNFIVAVQSRDQEWTQFQSTNGILSNGSLLVHKTNGVVNPLTPYDFTNSIGYLPSSQIQMLNVADVVVEPDGNTPSGDFIQNVTSLSISDGELTILGNAYQPGVYADDADSLKHYLIIQSGDTTIKEVELLNMYFATTHYNSAGFGGFYIDMSDLSEGAYTLSIKTVHASYTEVKPITNITGFSNKHQITTYKVDSDATKTTLTLSKDVIEEVYISRLNDFNMSIEGVLSLSGIAYVEGLTNSAETVMHYIDVISLDNNETIARYDLMTTTGDYDISDGYQHGLDYSHAWFEGTIDISKLEKGEYLFNIVAVVEGKEFSRNLRTSDYVEDIINAELNDNYVSILKQQRFSNRIEVHVLPYLIEVDSSKTTPSVLEAYNYISVDRYDSENNTLTIKGTSFIRRGSFLEEDNVKYTLYMIHEESGTYTTYESEGLNQLNDGDSYWDNTKEQVTEIKYDLDYTWYEFDIPLDVVVDGTYTFKLEIDTDDFNELIDVKGYSAYDFVSYDESGKIVKGSVDLINKQKIQYEISGVYK